MCDNRQCPPVGGKDPRLARVGGYRRQPIPQVGKSFERGLSDRNVVRVRSNAITDLATEVTRRSLLVPWSPDMMRAQHRGAPTALLSSDCIAIARFTSIAVGAVR